MSQNERQGGSRYCARAPRKRASGGYGCVRRRHSQTAPAANARPHPTPQVSNNTSDMRAARPGAASCRLSSIPAQSAPAAHSHGQLRQRCIKKAPAHSKSHQPRAANSTKWAAFRTACSEASGKPHACSIRFTASSTPLLCAPDTAAGWAECQKMNHSVHTSASRHTVRHATRPGLHGPAVRTPFFPARGLMFRSSFPARRPQPAAPCRAALPRCQIFAWATDTGKIPGAPFRRRCLPRSPAKMSRR